MAIAFVAAAGIAAASASASPSVDITIGSAYDMVVAYAAGFNPPTGINFNGVAMTSAESANNAAGVNAAGIFYMLSAQLPGTGTYTVQATFASTDTNTETSVGAIALSGVAQQAPEASTFLAINPATSSATPVSLQTITDNAWVVDAMIAKASTGGTLRASNGCRCNNLLGNEYNTRDSPC